MNLCDIEVIQEVLKQHGFRFSKSLGQNFLIEESVPRDIASGCNGAYALEVGAGMGCLTKELCKIAEKVVSIELDETLLPILKDTVGEFENLNIINQDILKADLHEICKENFPEDAEIHACANLPYYITSQAIATLIDSKCFKSITVMIQKEVAQRICADAGTKAYGAFSLYVNYHTKPEILFDVPAECFIPKPKVDSAVIRLECLEKPSVETDNVQLFFRIIKASFMQRRKTLHNSIASAFDGKLNKEEIAEVIIESGFEPSIRGERLTIQDFAHLSNVANDYILRKK